MSHRWWGSNAQHRTGSPISAVRFAGEVIVEARGDLRFGEPRTVALKDVSDGYRVHPVEWALA